MTDYEADIASYEIVSTLGQCFEGMTVIHLAKHKKSDTLVAIKRFNMDRIKHEAYLVEVCFCINRTAFIVFSNCRGKYFLQNN